MLKNFFNYLLLLLILSGCANQKPPTGGPEDLVPPKLKKATPENNSINFKGNTIILEFDEYVDAAKLRENIIISPLIESQYDIISNKKTVKIKFKEPFKENTTYTINFGESIKDVTKGNLTTTRTLAFSTGAFIDSLSIKGIAYNFVKGLPLKDVSIQLYDIKDTNTIKNSKPLYFTKTDATGNFLIQNIKEGKYNIYALQDINSNYKYDNEKESIAYIYDIVIDKKVKNIKLGLTRSDTKGPEIIGKKTEENHYVLNLSEGLENYAIKNPSIKIISSLSEDAKTIKIFNTVNSKDSIQLYCQFADSSGNLKLDTIKIIFPQIKAAKSKNTFYTNIPTNKLQIIKNETININFSNPVDKINYSKIKIKLDSTSKNSDETNLQLDSNLLTMKLINNSPFKDSLVIRFDKGAFLSISGDTNQLAKYKITYKKEEEFGIIGGTVICKDSNYIFQLINAKGKIIDSKQQAKKFYYTYLEPGNYVLKVIVDTNNNGRWDPTNIIMNTPPETIHYYKEKINLRANWELLDLKFETK